MNAKLTSCSLSLLTLCGILFANSQPAAAFDFLARRLGTTAVAAQKGVHQKGAVQKGATQKGVHQKGVHQKGVQQKGVHRKVVHQKGVSKRVPRQKLWAPHHKGASQKGGKSKGRVGSYHEAFESTPDAEAPLPEPVAPTATRLLRQSLPAPLSSRKNVTFPTDTRSLSCGDFRLAVS